MWGFFACCFLKDLAACLLPEGKAYLENHATVYWIQYFLIIYLNSFFLDFSKTLFFCLCKKCIASSPSQWFSMLIACGYPCQTLGKSMDLLLLSTIGILVSVTIPIGFVYVASELVQNCITSLADWCYRLGFASGFIAIPKGKCYDLHLGCTIVFGFLWTPFQDCEHGQGQGQGQGQVMAVTGVFVGVMAGWWQRSRGQAVDPW